METSNNSTDYYDYYPVYDYFTTVSVKQEPSHDAKDVARILSVVVYSLTCLLGILGNGLVISIITFKMKKSINAIWFLNLAVADFLFNVFLPLNIAYTAMNYHWVFGVAMCKLNSFLLNLNLYSSVLLLTTISLDRCVSVVLPVWAQNHRTTTLACLICGVDWVLGVAMSSPSLVFRDTASHKGNVICFSNYTLSGNQSDHRLGMMRHQTVNMVRFLIGFVIPITIITVCYMIIFVKLKRNRLAKSKKPFKIIVAIIVTFFLCWAPYHVLQVLETQHDQVSHVVLETGIPITTALAAASSCMNPILYVFMGQDFQKFKLTVLSRLVNALSEGSTHSTLTQRSFSKMSSMTEKDTTLL
ncbi:chemerin-like receptor 1 [Malaclemys terrapin pileata]|uniref:chemerin-like receptor 1 n=1 Tax=Malaclemys terrapin pileata TaxID=2991368 RepID=UPI0023A7D99C|nr:chemerin-like receptor 1 [Malaclemys terrapin pileata]XP_053862499.1 chemerin-like receptor 1 [Malaclemys terrapin pileata]XP_053862500.1 chemerin-like receptor 1 [Malaclemys terrapin pileata]XP_053862501.1 chemerin-like receptor 1 [Malaclemys terrapin pileata]